MIHCTNCGQSNTDTSHFCRSCGNRFTQQQPSQTGNYEYSPPQPYSWKTDEYQVADYKKPRSQTINQVQPLPNPFITSQTTHGQPLVQHQPHSMAHGYRCPRCASQALPVHTKRISTAGWIVFAVLLVFFFPLFWIGLLIKEDVRLCPACNLKLG